MSVPIIYDDARRGHRICRCQRRSAEPAHRMTKALWEAGGRILLGTDTANPLEDVRFVASRVGVMLRGRWFPEAELERRLEELAASYAKQSRSDEPSAGE